MMKFSALNESSLSDDDGDPDLATKEAQEEEAYSSYQLALRKQYEGQLEEAEEIFKELLKTEFLTDAEPQDEEEENTAPLGPALTLKYLVNKNLASICKGRKDFHQSIAFYLEALEIDKSDVMMWYNMGKASIEIVNYPLARLSFEEGLKCSPNHWPSMDNLISVMYTLNDYANCLYYIAQALEKEPYYLKGLTLMDQMYKEDPSLKSFCGEYFIKCDPSIHDADYDKEEAEQYVQECLSMREKKRSLCKPEPSPVLSLGIPITEFTWKHLGDSLVNVYDRIANADPFVSYTCKIDLSPYVDNSSKACENNLDKTAEPSPLSSLSEANSSSSASVPATKPNGVSAPVAPTSQDPAVSEMEIDENSENKNPDPVLLPLVEPAPSSDLSACNDSISSTRKPAKRKRNEFADLSEFVYKRRSSRVRNPTIKRPLDNTNYQELLHKFLPSRLIGDGKFEQDYDSDQLSQDKSSNDFSVAGSEKEKKDLVDLFSLMEKEEVSNFISKNQANAGIIDLLYRYVTKLASKSNMPWPKDLIEVYCNAFSRLRNHITTPNLFSTFVEPYYIKAEGLAFLVFYEFKIDHWLRSNGSSLQFSEKISLSSFGLRCDRIGDDFYSDMEFLVQLPSRFDVLGEDWLNVSTRALWLKAKLHSLEGEIDLAVSCMRKLYNILSEEVGRDLKIMIQNCEYSNVITIGNVQQQLESLQRCQSLEEVQRLYEHGDYAAVVDLLILTFNQPRANRKQALDGVPERHTQLLYLQNSLIKLERYKECVYWSEMAFNEALQQFMNATKNAEWSETMAQLLSGLEKCAKIDYSYLSDLEESKLIRLTQNLILIIVIQMESCEFAGDNASLLVVLPWIILYRMILNEEKKNKKSEENAEKGKSSSLVANDFLTDTDLNSAMPSSLMLLYAAHEYLGRRYWCTASDGLLLLTFMDIIMTELQDTSGNATLYREDLETGIEQCIYCLYGHPNKRSRAKHLTEHSAKPIALTWERACFIFDYFKPNILPEFDSYRTSTISAELECLFKRISALVPPEEDPTTRVDAYTAYIEGGTEKCPDPPFHHKKFSNIVQDLYYLMGDYYFKNKEFNKAIRYYLYDICINPDRQDSWAGMALSRSAQLEQKLNSYELKNESTVYRKSSAALRCFEHALKLDPTTTSLWIEYGSLAYILHSHASRQLKQETFCEELHDLLKKKELEMLEIAERCFKAANRCDDGGEPEEAWLHHYILGKISEKKGEGPTVFLDHFKKAMNYLHEDFARYPQKILYHNPAELSIEALEIYYRVHASCLKYLWKREITGCDIRAIKVIQQCLKAVKASPFYSFQEKCRSEIVGSSSNAASDTEDAQDSEPTNVPDFDISLKPPESQEKVDHDYFSNADKEVKKISEDSRSSRPSTDSLPESPDFVAIKEIIESLIGVVVERFVDEAKMKLGQSDVDASIAVEGKLDSSVSIVESVAEESVYTLDIKEAAKAFEVTEEDDLFKLQMLAEELEHKSVSCDETETTATAESESAEKLETSDADAMEIDATALEPAANDDEVLMSLSSILSSLEAVKKLDADTNDNVSDAKKTKMDIGVSCKENEGNLFTEGGNDPEISSKEEEVQISIDEANDPRLSPILESKLELIVEEIKMDIDEAHDNQVSSNADVKNAIHDAASPQVDMSLAEVRISCNEATFLEETLNPTNPSSAEGPLKRERSETNCIQCVEISNSDNTSSSLTDQQNSSNDICKAHLPSELNSVNEVQPSNVENKKSSQVAENKDVSPNDCIEKELENTFDSQVLPKTDGQDEEQNSYIQSKLPCSDNADEMPELQNLEELKKSEKKGDSLDAEAKEKCKKDADDETASSSEPLKNYTSSSAKGAENQLNGSDASKQPEPPSTDKMRQESIKENPGSPTPTEEELEKSKSEISRLVPKCLDAMRECLHRFPQHYKALYRLAHYYCHSKTNQNLQWAREILLAATPATKKYSPMAGLFAERKNTNFFNGIWRAPSNEIDRAGSFGAHMYRSVQLLIEVLYHQGDYNLMVHLTQQLYRTPDLGKKYMRDTDRVFLVRKAYDACVNILRDKMNTLLQEEPPPEESQLICCLLEIYRTCLTLWKAGINVSETNNLLEEAYTMYRIGEVDSQPSVLEQATKFCQIQLSKAYPAESSKSSFSSKYLNVPDVSILQSTTSGSTGSSYNAEAWQKGKRT